MLPHPQVDLPHYRLLSLLLLLCSPQSVGEWIKETYQTVFERLAATLADVRLGVNITSITRPAPGATGPVTIRYTQQAPASSTPASHLVSASSGSTQPGEQALQCTAVITAFPQTLPALSAMFDLDPREVSLFSQVRTTSYWSSLLDLSP